MLVPWKKSYDQPRQHIKKQSHYFADKGPSSQGYGSSHSHVWMWKLDHEEGWEPKNWCFWTVVLEKTLESPLDCRQSKQSVLKEISPEYWLRLKLQYFGHMMWNEPSKDPDAGKDGRREEKGTTGWDVWMASLNGWHEFEQAPGVSDGQGSLACCSPWGHKESDTTEWLNWADLNLW